MHKGYSIVAVLALLFVFAQDAQAYTTKDDPRVFIPTGREDPEKDKICREEVGIQTVAIPVDEVYDYRRCMNRIHAETTTRNYRDRVSRRQVDSTRLERLRSARRRFYRGLNAKDVSNRRILKNGTDAIKEKVTIQRASRRTAIQSKEREVQMAYRQKLAAIKKLKLACADVGTGRDRVECIQKQIHNFNLLED